MAISIQSARNDYFGNGVQTVFPYVFKILLLTDLVVVVTDLNQNETTLIYPTDYTISGLNSANGGNVILAVALTNLYQITVRRLRPLTQTTSIKNDGEYYAKLHEDAFDKLLMVDQQQQEQIDRSLKVFLAEDALFNRTLPKMYGQIQRVIGTNVGGNGLDLGPTFNEIDNAQASALAAAASAASAQTSATSAGTSATNAAASAVAAAASAAAASAAGFSASGPFAVTNGQAATNLLAETYDGVVYSSVMIFFEIKRGTTVMAAGTLTLNYLNGTWRIEEGNYTGEVHGVTWSITQSTTVGQLQAALDSGAGNGTIKFKKSLFPA